MISRSALVGGICGHIRALCLKESVQRYGDKPQRTNSLSEGGSVAERVREKSCQCRSEQGKIEEGRFLQTMCHCSGGGRCVNGRSVHLQKTAACLSDSVPDCWRHKR
ncbi:hypothetical protein T4D_11523 [Trichinella pseudospiralis]|uniref:Uncharacterized protein n=1 Tax=Trichinella pseudospiralis TaxID=6337 RepID=A0A0V1F1W5_TRIPS|nr:hypothetical protein T4D_11523 [Trichinella pseudospiralis]